MKLLQTNNGRLRVDPEAIIAIEMETIAPMGFDQSIIYLDNRRRIQCTKEEATEIALQWEQYMAELDPDDDEDQDDDDDDQDEIEVPETIDIAPQPKKLRRRAING